MTTTLVSAWTGAKRRLEAAGIDSPVIDARLLVEAAAASSRAEIISDPHRVLTEDQAAALEAYVDVVTDALKAGEEVRLVGFGSFIPVDRPAGLSRNPRTGAQVKRKASRTARFRIGEGLKGALN